MTLQYPMLPPPVDRPTLYDQSFDAAVRAEADRHPLAALIRLRQEAAAQIDMLIQFLDATDDVDADSQVDDEAVDEDERDDDRDSGIGDYDGLLEQLSGLIGYTFNGVGTSGFARGVE